MISIFSKMFFDYIDNNKQENKIKLENTINTYKKHIEETKNKLIEDKRHYNLKYHNNRLLNEQMYNEFLIKKNKLHDEWNKNNNTKTLYELVNLQYPILKEIPEIYTIFYIKNKYFKDTDFSVKKEELEKKKVVKKEDKQVIAPLTQIKEETKISTTAPTLVEQKTKKNEELLNKIKTMLDAKKQENKQVAKTITTVPSTAKEVAKTITTVPSTAKEVAKTITVAPSTAKEVAKTITTVPSTAKEVAKTITVAPSTAKEVAKTITVVPSTAKEVAKTITVVPSTAKEVAKTITVVPSTAKEVAKTITVVPSTAKEVAKKTKSNEEFLNRIKTMLDAKKQENKQVAKTTSVIAPSVVKKEDTQVAKKSVKNKELEENSDSDFSIIEDDDQLSIIKEEDTKDISKK